MIQVGKGSVPVRSWSAARFPGGSLLLAMAGYGVASCPQGLLSFYADTVRGQLGVGEGKLLVGISFGHADENAPVNRVAAGRAAMKETTTFHAWSRPRKRWSQPLFEGCDQHGRLVSDGEFVVSRGHSAVPFQPTDPALHRVPFLVVVLVEDRCASASGAELLAVAYSVCLFRGGASDSASARAGPVRAGSAGFVGTGLSGIVSQASGTSARYANAFEEGLELRAVVTVARSGQQGQRRPPLLDHEVDLRRQATAGTSEPVIVRLGVADPAGGSPDALFLRAGSMPVGTAGGPVHAHGPGDQPLRIGLDLRLFQDPLPCAVAPPAAEQVVIRSQGPYRSGTSRQGVPARVRRRLPSFNCRRVHVHDRPGCFPASSSGSGRAGCQSVGAPRAKP